MRAVGVKVLKNKLSHYLRIVSSGETVLVTDRDQVIAELSPPSPGRAESVTDAFIADAVREGWLTPAAHPKAPLPERKPILPLSKILEDLANDRKDR